MALVHRSELIARATVRPVGAHSGQDVRPPGASGAVGAVPGPTSPAAEATYGQYPPRQPGPQPPGPPFPGGQAAATPSRPASAAAVLIAVLLVVIGAAIAYGLDRTGTKAAPFKIGNQTSAYAGLAVFAAALERILETFTQWLPGGSKVKAEFEQVMTAFANGHPSITLTDVANAKAKLDHSTANRAVVIWGLASAVATVVALLSGFCLLHMIAGDNWNPSSIPYWVDAVVTGVAVGTGTKPLHDLITKAQNARDAATGK